MSDLDALLPAGAKPIRNEPDLTEVPPSARPEPTGTNGHPAPVKPTAAAPSPPPHDLEAERHLLGAALLGAHHALQDLPEGAFYKPSHGNIAAAIKAVAATGAPPDTITVGDQLRRLDLLDHVGGTAALAEIMAACPASSAAPAYATIVDRHWRSRQLLHAAAELAQTARTKGPDAAHELLRSLVDTTTPKQAGDRLHAGSWLLDAPALPQAIWGADSDVLWAAGEPCLLTGPPGVGKTTLTGQLVRARIGLDDQVLGYPMAPDTQGKVLYLASDRPQQIRRALARLFTPAEAQWLDDRLTLWAGPPPGDIAKDTSLLVNLAQQAGATTIILDSLKDMAIGLSDDEVGAGVNQAMQLAIAAGIDVLALHHQRKGTDGKRPKTLEDLYGSTWISAGAGSVVLLWGQAGDLVVELHHLKQPAADVGPLQIEHDHHAGRSWIHKGFDLLTFVRNRPTGATAQDAARAWLEKDKPTDNERKKAQRRLENYVRLGQLHKVTTDTRNPDGTVAAARYLPIDHTHPHTPTGPAQPALDDPPTTPTGPGYEEF